ncbi:cysteine hydrolase family protein [Mangrovicoccus algicola]|uniref:Isochorismatase family protein n=1 Tax=Mangrovicoccus algicola TaxID=2771008 RepID=A0A8J7CL59_9RHOB|nr:isochorismatase family cysteine hydrolase [Mangrovicoccus algicola]MBE3639526.1 isochorismatase family protein [Mangrovicoccus algicola]
MTDRDLVPLGAFAQNAWSVSAAEVSLVRARDAARPVTLGDRDRKVTLDIGRTAIVVVDMQNDFCHPQGWLAHIGVDVAPCRAPIAPLQALLPMLREAGVPVIWLNWGNRPDRANLPPSVLHVYDPDGRSTGIGKPLPGNGAHVLEEGSWAAAVVDELAPAPGDIAVSKYRMTGFQDTELEAILRNLDVTTVLFAGVNADQCVLNTLTDAVARGFDAVLLEDCSATSSPAFCMEATLYNVRQCYGFVCDGADLRAALEAGA